MLSIGECNRCMVEARLPQISQKYWFSFPPLHRYGWISYLFIYLFILLLLFFFIESKLFQLVVEEGGGGGETFSSLRFLNGENISCNQFLWVRMQH